MANFDIKVVTNSECRRWAAVWKPYVPNLKEVSFQSNMEYPVDVCNGEEDRYSPDYIKRVLRLSELKACTS